MGGGVFVLIKRIIGAALTAVLLGATGFADEGIQVLAIPDASGDAVDAAAAIVMEAETGRVLFAQHADKRLPIASTTKIMTALLTLEQPEIDIVFEVDSGAIRVEGSSMGLQGGDKASLRVLAAGMLLASGNDAAGAAAVRISGSVPSFVAAMNRRADSLGMEDTSFETPSGLDGERHYSTAYDMAILTREALRNEEFAALCSQYKLRTSYGDPPYDRWLTNHNKLLTYYEGAIGVKTGFTKKAGRCLVSAARRDGVTLLCVTLACPDDWNVHEALYDRYFGRIKVEDLAEGVPAVSVPVTGGVLPAAEAVVYDAAPVPVPTDAYDVEYRVTTPHFLYAPVLAGQSIGEVKIMLDGVEVGRLSLVADRNIALRHEFEEEVGWLEQVRGWLGAPGE
jgi:D-alanyl-D-alanine carboxypeptidase/D-alanyl-D-alanine carboxypeptidase (penicillin-binding protein 5/6)